MHQWAAAWLGWILLVVALPAWAATPISDAEREALGVARYRAVLFSAQTYADPDIASLRTPNTDVERVAEVLRDQYGFETEVLPEATHEVLIATLDRLVQTTAEDDVLLLYYAGHGVLVEKEERGYWLPVDASTANTARWVSTEDVAAKVRAIPARHVLVVSDSCFSGVLTRAVEPVDLPPVAPGLESAAQLSRQRSRWVLASGANEPVTDGGADGMSVFAYFLRDSLLQADDRYVTPDAIFPKVRQTVSENSEQTPTQGKLAKGMQTYGQLVLVNQSAIDCSDAESRAALDAALASAHAEWEEQVMPMVRTGSANALAVVDDWIARWSDATAEVCGSSTLVDPPDLSRARQVREGLISAAGPVAHTRKWPTTLLISGGVVAATGGALVAGTGGWWLQNRDVYVVGDGQIGAPTADDRERFLRNRALNIAGGAALVAGMAAVGVGGVGIATTPAGTTTVTLRLPFR